MKMKNNKLLPCPFCGGKVKLDKYTDVVGRNKFGIVCKNEECNCLPFTSWWASKEDAIKSWNTRKPMERIAERLEEEEGEAYARYKKELDLCLSEYWRGRSSGLNKAIYIVRNGVKE